MCRSHVVSRLCDGCGFRINVVQLRVIEGLFIIFTAINMLKEGLPLAIMANEFFYCF